MFFRIAIFLSDKFHFSLLRHWVLKVGFGCRVVIFLFVRVPLFLGLHAVKYCEVVLIGGWKEFLHKKGGINSRLGLLCFSYTKLTFVDESKSTRSRPESWPTLGLVIFSNFTKICEKILIECLLMKNDVIFLIFKQSIITFTKKSRINSVILVVAFDCFHLSEKHYKN